MSSRPINSSLSSFTDTSRRVNRRFIAYVDQTFARQMRQRRQLLLAIGVMASAMLVIIAATTLHNTHEFWTALLICLLVIAFCGVQAVRRLLRWRRNTQQMRGVLQNGVPMNAFLVQANAALLKAQHQIFPCLVLISFQPEVSGEIEYMQALARRVYSFKNTHPDDADSRFVADLTTNERAVTGRRRQLPLSFTDGSVIYCIDLMVRPAYLQGSRLQSDILPCIAESGPDGEVELIPWWLLAEPEKSLTPFSKTEGSRLGL